MMKKVCIGVVLLGWLWSVHAIAQDAGWINYFDGTPENYQIKRGNEMVPVGLFTVLQVGDKISVNNPQNAIELRLDGGIQEVKVTKENSPFQIGMDNQVPPLLNKQWIRIKALFNDWLKFMQPDSEQAENASEQPNNCASPSKPLVALLENMGGPAFLSSGERSLHLQWYGGKSPYRVLIQQRHNRLLSKITLKPAIETKVINFEANKSYRVTIFDAKGEFFMGGFRVIEPTMVPTMPEALQEVLQIANLPDNLHQTLQATWLAVQTRNNWILEAYQQLARLTNYPPAQLLKKVLSQKQEASLCNRGLRGIRG